MTNFFICVWVGCFFFSLSIWKFSFWIFDTRFLLSSLIALSSYYSCELNCCAYNWCLISNFAVSLSSRSYAYSTNACCCIWDFWVTCVLLHAVCNEHFVLFFRKYYQEIADLILNDAIIECKLWDESATIVCCINSGRMHYPCSKKHILCIGRVCIIFITLYIGLFSFINFFSCLFVLQFY